MVTGSCSHRKRKYLTNQQEKVQALLLAICDLLDESKLFFTSVIRA